MDTFIIARQALGLINNSNKNINKLLGGNCKEF